MIRILYRRAIFPWVVIAALIFLALEAHALPPLERSVSVSRQFVVYSSDVRVRAALCSVAERTKATLLALLQQPDRWRTPIVINAASPQANLPETPDAHLNFSQTGFGLKLQLDLVLGPDLQAAAIEREILRAILLEMIYRRQPDLPAGVAYVRPPEWLIDGVLAWGTQRDPAELGAALKTMTTANRVTSLEEFLRQRPETLDTPSREIYRSYSYALVRLLNRSGALTKFIADLSDAPNDLRSDLIAHCSKLGGSAENAERVWKNSVEELAGLTGYESLTVAETERRLESALHFQFPASKEPDRFWNLEDYSAFQRQPGRALVFNQMTEDLMALGVRANPMARPIVREYQNIAFRLTRGNTRGLSRQLTRVKDARERLVARAKEIDDYMNWFEATQPHARSGSFVDLLKTADEPARSRRRDAISVYLDSVETELHN